MQNSSANLPNELPKQQNSSSNSWNIFLLLYEIQSQYTNIQAQASQDLAGKAAAGEAELTAKASGKQVCA